jgi:hypothetical protein
MAPGGGGTDPINPRVAASRNQRSIDRMRAVHHACTWPKAHAIQAGRTLSYFSFSFSFLPFS